MWKEYLEVFMCFGKGLRARSCLVTHLDSSVIPEVLKMAILKVWFSEFTSFIYAWRQVLAKNSQIKHIGLVFGSLGFRILSFKNSFFPFKTNIPTQTFNNYCAVPSSMFSSRE